jgi:hypothetical protein
VPDDAVIEGRVVKPFLVEIADIVDVDVEVFAEFL